MALVIIPLGVGKGRAVQQQLAPYLARLFRVSVGELVAAVPADAQGMSGGS